MVELEEREEELLINLAFFTRLASRLPDQVKYIEILLKRIRATNKLSSYRYTAVIHLRRPEEQAQPTFTINRDA
jgi:hypothetical protein